MYRLITFRVSLVFLGLFVGSAAHAGNTLPELLVRARAYDAEYRAAEAARDAGLMSRALGRAQLLPTASFTYTKTQTDLDRTFLNGSAPTNANYSPSTYVFSLSQSIINFSKSASFQQESARAKLAELRFVEASTELTLRVARSYFDNLLAVDQLRLAREQKKAYSAQREQAEKLREAGTLSITDVADTRAREMTAVATEVEAEFGLRQRRAELARIVGPDSSLDLTPVGEFLPTDPVPADLNFWLQASDDNNPKILAAQMALEVARWGAEQAERAHLPSLDLIGSSSRVTGPNDSTDVERGHSIGVRLTVPLYEGGRTAATADRAGFLRGQSEAEYENARREAVVKVSESFLGVGNARAKTQALKLALEAAELGVRGSLAGRTAGVKTQTDVLNALQQQYQVERDLNRERYSYLFAGMQLKALCGNLTEESLVLPGHLLVRAPTLESGGESAGSERPAIPFRNNESQNR